MKINEIFEIVNKKTGMAVNQSVLEIGRAHV